MTSLAGLTVSGIPHAANHRNRKGHKARKELLGWLLSCCGFAFYFYAGESVEFATASAWVVAEAAVADR
jgi:hypothetical protein